MVKDLDLFRRYGILRGLGKPLFDRDLLGLGSRDSSLFRRNYFDDLIGLDAGVRYGNIGVSERVATIFRMVDAIDRPLPGQGVRIGPLTEAMAEDGMREGLTFEIDGRVYKVVLVPSRDPTYKWDVVIVRVK